MSLATQSPIAPPCITWKCITPLSSVENKSDIFGFVFYFMHTSKHLRTVICKWVCFCYTVIISLKQCIMWSWTFSYHTPTHSPTLYNLKMHYSSIICWKQIRYFRFCFLFLLVSTEIILTIAVVCFCYTVIISLKQCIMWSWTFSYHTPKVNIKLCR
jgi:hypothetical protein